MFDKQLFSLPGIKAILAALGVLAIVQAAAIVGQALSLAQALTNLWYAQTVESQSLLIGVFFACFVLKHGMTTAQDALLAGYASKQASRLRNQLLEKAFTGHAGWVPAHGTASVTTCALDGIDQVENYLKVILPKVINAGAILPATLVTAFVLDWVSGIILLAVLPVIVFYMIMLGRMAQDRAARQYSTYQVLSNHFIDTLRGLPTLKVFGASKRHAKEVFRISEDFREATVQTLRTATLSSVVLDLLATLGVAAVAMLLGFRLVDGSMPLFIGLATLIIAPEYFAPLRQFASDFHASLDGRNALADILKLVETDATEDTQDCEIPLWGPHSKLEIRDLSFTYPPDDEHEEGYQALNKLSLEASGFERIGIIGASGSGKSTLASLLGGFIVPDSGTISIDGKPLSLNALQQPGWQKQVLYIPQDPYIFRASLRDNIAFYTPNASDEDIARAVETVGLAPLVSELPDGLNTLIGEGGRGLSGGQAQRIALARALLDPTRRILIFDEPTAHLDIETELELKDRMLPLMQSHLVLFATHRHHWLPNMDKILQIDPLPTRNPTRADAKAAQQPEHPHKVPQSGTVSPTYTAATPENAMKTPLQGPAGEGSTRSSAATENAQWAFSPSEDCLSMEPPPADPPSAFKQNKSENAAGQDTWVRPYFTKYRKQLTAALGLGIATSIFSAAMMLTAGYLISATAEAPGSILFYYLPIAFVQLFGIGKPLLHYFERLASHDWVFRMTSSLRVRLYKVLELQALKPHTRSAGEVLGLVADDIGHIQNLYLRTIFPLVIGWVLFALAIIALGVVDIAFAAVMILALGLAAVVAPVVAVRVNRMRVKQHKALQDQLYQQLTDDMLGASDWVFAGRGKECATNRASAANTMHGLQERIDRYARVNDFAVAVLMGGIAVALLCWAAFSFGGSVGGSANWIAALVLGFFPLVEVFSPLSSAAMQANTHRDSISHLNTFPDTDDSVDFAEPPAQQVEDATVQFENVSYTYPDTTRPVLAGVNLSVPAGQRVAMLGQSGSGKSTMASLVRGDIEPDVGSVHLGGKDLSTFGDAIAHSIGVVQQNPYLFNRPLRENLVLGRPDATDDEIWDALERVKLADMVRRLPQQLDTLVDEAGMRFSGGERHRLALARVLLADTPIVLLDEPTVGLDPIIEQEILDTLIEATQGKTLLLITHHLQGIEAFDRVIFLENGQIELDGHPDDLAATNPRYQQLLAFDRA